MAAVHEDGIINILRLQKISPNALPTFEVGDQRKHLHKTD